MPTIHAILTLLDDTILSAHSKTVEVAQSLTYIPGRVLLGAVASRLYAKLSQEEQFSVFHASGVRFMDARPVVFEGGKVMPTYAVPLSYHHEKGTRLSKSVDDKSYLTNKVENFVEGRRKGVQYKQVRSLFMTESMQAVSIAKNGSLRTSLKDGQARESYLFGFDAIRKGTQFLAAIEVESEAIYAQIKDILADGIRVGRSKTAEFGRVQVELIESNQLAEASVSSRDIREVPLYFASDVAIRNRYGQPSLDLNEFAKQLGASGWVAEKTFIRTRRYSPFHGVRFRPDLERQVWTMGSVVTLCFDEMEAVSSLNERLSDGVGEYTHEGLGEVLADPTFLQLEKVGEVVPEKSVQKQEKIPVPESLTWLIQHQNQHNYDLKVEALVDDWMKQFKEQFPEHARYISKTQWGKILEISRVYSDDQALCNYLVGTSMNEQGGGFVFSGSRKLKTSWGYRVSEGADSLAELLYKCVQRHMKDRKQAVPELYSPVRMKDVVGRFAKKMRGGTR